MRRALMVLLVAAPLLGALDPAAAPSSLTVPLCHTTTPANDDAPAPAAAILKGYGTGGFKITTNNRDAQAYFDNGMQLAHAFAHKAAIGAFMRAEELDPACAMCVWGEAWSRGPTINYSIKPKVAADLATLADKAAVLAKDGPAKERALIAALQLRYHDGGGQGKGDDAFAKAMDALARAHPEDNEIAVITADAWMIPASLGGNRNNLGRAREILVAALNRDPKDTGAIHFYIHATENDGVGPLALPYAETLQALAPAASHLVHMPSHTFLWSGRFKMAEQSNIDAVKIDQANAARLKTKGGVFGLGYHGHNVQFGMGAALLDNDAKGALFLAADELAQAPQIKADDVYGQAVLGTAYFSYGRFADLKVVQTLPDPGARLPFDAALRQYAIGEAAARQGDVVAVEAAADALARSPTDFPALKSNGDRALARSMIEVARLVLVGRAAMLEQRYGDAERAYRKAADIEGDHLRDFRDPPFWWYPVRRSLAAALLAEGKTQAAAKEAQTVLVWWPYDPISLRLLADSGAKTDPAGRSRIRDAEANWTGDIRALPTALM
jgi:tetratricopeptide (TPR) repeat protein